MSLNKVLLMGRLGQNPELRYTPSGQGVCTFSLATSESWKDKNSGEKQEKTEWHRVVVWGKMGELCNQYLSKGRQAFVEGKLQTRSWDDKATGAKRYTTEILASSVQFIGGAGDSANTQQSSYSSSSANSSSASSSSMENNDIPVPGHATFTPDDIPF